MKTRTKVQAGRIAMNRSAKKVRVARVRGGVRIRTSVKAGTVKL